MIRALPLFVLAGCVVDHATVEITVASEISELELYIVSDTTCDALLSTPERVIDGTVWNYERFAVDARPALSVQPPEGRYVIFVSALAADGASFAGHGCAEDVLFTRGRTTRIDIRLR